MIGLEAMALAGVAFALSLVGVVVFCLAEVLDIV